MSNYQDGTKGGKYKFRACPDSPLGRIGKKERDAESTYDYFGARYYNNKLGVWLSVDPLAEKYPSYNPYNYCANNPMILVDETGMSFSDFTTTVYSDGNQEKPKYPDGDKKKQSGKQTTTNASSTTINPFTVVAGAFVEAGKDLLSALGLTFGSASAAVAVMPVVIHGDSDPNQLAEQAQMRAENASNKKDKEGTSSSKEKVAKGEDALNGAEHVKGKRPSTENKHQKGQSRKVQDQGKEKADGRRINWK